MVKRMWRVNLELLLGLQGFKGGGFLCVKILKTIKIKCSVRLGIVRKVSKSYRMYMRTRSVMVLLVITLYTHVLTHSYCSWRSQTSAIDGKGV